MAEKKIKTVSFVHIGDKLVNDVAPKDRDIAMVFQNYALYLAQDHISE